MVDSLIKSLTYFWMANQTDLESEGICKTLRFFGITENCPLVFWGLIYDLYLNEQLKYYKRDVAKQVEDKLFGLEAANKNAFDTGFMNSFEYLFLSIDFFDNVCNLISETKKIAYDNELKNSIYRIPVFNGLTENVLMNLYRCLLRILEPIRGKSYSEQNSLGEAIPVLNRENMKSITQVNKNLRNSINHGQFYNLGDKSFYKYQNSGNWITNEIASFELDEEIDKVFDISTGIIIGMLRFWSQRDLLISRAIEKNDETKISMIKLLYRAKQTHIKFIDYATSVNQINMHVVTKILDKSKLGICLTELLRCLYTNFTRYDKYFIGYNHLYSCAGFISLNKHDTETYLSVMTDNIHRKLTSDALIMIPEIRSDIESSTEYKYFRFPEINGLGWSIEDLEVISTDKEKRIKGYLIFDEKESKAKIETTIVYAIEKIKIIPTPDNPHHKVKYGYSECDSVFIRTFVKPETRSDYSIVPDNMYFICIANYYKDLSVTRLMNGGSTAKYWKIYKKKNKGNIEYAWNPIYKG